MAAQDLPPGLTDRYYAAAPTPSPVPSVAAVRATGLPMAAALANGTVTPPAPTAPVAVPALAEKAGLLTQRALNGMRSLLGMSPLTAASPAPTPVPTPAAPQQPVAVATPTPNNFYQAKTAAQPLTASAY